MTILEWIMRGCSVGRDDLRLLLSHRVVCLQETLLAANPVPIPGYNFFSFPHSLYNTCILLHHTTLYEQLVYHTILPCNFVRVYLNRWITVVSIHFSPSQPIDYTAFTALLFNLPTPFLLLGDNNCRNT